MAAHHPLKWTVIPLLVAAWTTAPAAPAPAPAPAPSAGVAGNRQGETERSFDSSITIPELFEKGREAFHLNQFDLAVEFYQEILIRDRANVQAMLELANVYERGGRLEYARGLLVRSARILPGNRDIADRLAAVEHMLAIVLAAEVDSLMAAGQYELAVPKLSVHLSIEPESPELLYKRALCYGHLGRPDAALSSVNRAIQIDPKEKYYQLRSSLLNDLKVQETREKVAEAKRLLELSDPESRHRALELLRDILSIRPDHAWARSELARLTGGTPVASVDTLEGTGVREATEGVAAFLARAGRETAGTLRLHLGAILMLAAAWLVFRSPLTRRLHRVLSPKSPLSGAFPRFTLTEILIMLNTESHTGVLQVKGDRCRGKVYIENGEPSHCEAGKLHGVKALHHLLSHTQRGRFQFGDGSIPLNRTIDTPLSIVLVDHSGGGPTRSARKRAASAARAKKAKSKMKELLESKRD